MIRTALREESPISIRRWWICSLSGRNICRPRIESPHRRQDRVEDRHPEGQKRDEERGPHLALDRSHNGEGGDHVADEITSPVAHEDAGRVEVVAEKAQERPGQGRELQRGQIIGLHDRPGSPSRCL